MVEVCICPLEASKLAKHKGERRPHEPRRRVRCSERAQRTLSAEDHKIAVSHQRRPGLIYPRQLLPQIARRLAVPAVWMRSEEDLEPPLTSDELFGGRRRLRRLIVLGTFLAIVLAVYGILMLLG